MKNYKSITLTITGLALFFCLAAQSDCQSKSKKEQAGKDTNMNKNTPEKMPDEEVSQPNQMKIKTIDEGANSKIEKPFIFIARSAETYEQLRSLTANLPSVSKLDFNKSAVIAAFAGTQSSGGYFVDIKKSGDKISVELVAPPKDAMTTQALTTPYIVAAIPVETEDDFSLKIDKHWANAAQNYKITSGDFEYSGGFDGRVKKFGAEGTISILSYGNEATLIFDFSGTDTEKMRKLNSAASGKIKNGNIDLQRLDAGSFSESPKPPVRVSGNLTNGKLNLIFEPLRTNVADGFQLQGKIEAVKNN